MVIKSLNSSLLKEKKYSCFLELRSFPNVSLSESNACAVSACTYTLYLSRAFFFLEKLLRVGEIEIFDCEGGHASV